VDIRSSAAVYTLVEGAPLKILHHGEPLTVTVSRPVERPLPPVPVQPEPQQPRGRRPADRMGGAAMTGGEAVG
jgi:alpha,alpha-trehalose phosphorylase